MAKVLITGASGLIGTKLTELLIANGYEVNHLNRSIPLKNNIKRITNFAWNPENGAIDTNAFDGVNAIVHLAGAGVAEKRWTEARKKEIIESRVKSTQLLHDFLKNNTHQVQTFVSASAVGYYGDCNDEIVTEEHKPGIDFLASVCKKWEAGAIKIGKLGIREIRCRLGIVLAANGGALPQLTKTIPLGIASYFTKPNLYYPWIHIDDVCGIMIYAIQHSSISGAFNTTAPTPLLYKDIVKQILKAKKSNALLMPAPTTAIKLALGEMSDVILGSQRCSAQKIMRAGYKYRFGDIETALNDIYKSNKR
jgi:uncharacterized protein (TIGR01777 family)